MVVSERTPVLPKTKSYVSLISPTESKADYSRRWQSLSIGFVATFVLSFQNSIFWASMYPYLKEIDKTATATFFGFLVASQSLGATISAPLLSIMSRRIHSVKIPILFGFGLNIVGNLMIAFVEALPDNRKWMLLAARFIGGMGSGSRGVISLFTVMATSLDERNHGLTIQASVSSAALMMGPGIQAVVVFVGYPGYDIGYLKVNMYTAPALFSILLVTVLGVLMLVVFKEYDVAGLFKRQKMKLDQLRKSESMLILERSPYDRTAACCCIMTRFCILFCVTYDGTIGSPLTMEMFNWSPSETVLYNGILMASAGVLDFLGNLLVGNVLLKYISERFAMILGMFLFLLFYLGSFPYPTILPLLNETASNVTFCSFEWCKFTTRVNIYQYMISYAFVPCAMAFAYTPSVILLSRIIGPHDQGMLQGLNAAGGSVALMISPVLVSFLFQHFGPRISASIASLILIVGISFNLVNYRKLRAWVKRSKTGIFTVLLEEQFI